MAQVTIGTHQFEALVSVEDADRHLAGDILRGTGWALRNADGKGRAIVSATRLLLAQPMCAPLDMAALPVPLVEVAAELAADLAAKPALLNDASGNSNVKVAKAGSAQVEFFAPVSGGTPLPTAMWNRLLAGGVICPGGAAGVENGEESALGGVYVSGISSGCSVRPLEGRYAFDLPRDDCEGLI